MGVVNILEPGRASRRYWADLWDYRELFYFLSWRDVLVRYKQTAIGVAWSVLRPLLTMVVFTVVFGRFAKLPSAGVPYALLVYAGMLPWQFFASALSDGSSSLLDNANLLSKVYFPRLIIPASCVIVSLVDFAISLGIYAALMLWFGVLPDAKVLLLPLFLLLALAAALGGGLWLSAFNVKYRDFRYVVPFLVQFGLYVSPVGFSSSVVPAAWRPFYFLNPMAGVIDGFRWALLGGAHALYLPGLLISTAVALALFASGFAYFRRTERTFADVI
jgi:lipopolysaccharide transport system permease protein